MFVLEAVVLSVALLASHTRSAFCSRFQALSLPSTRDTFFSSYSILRRLLFFHKPVHELIRALATISPLSSPSPP